MPLLSVAGNGRQSLQYQTYDISNSYHPSQRDCSVISVDGSGNKFEYSQSVGLGLEPSSHLRHNSNVELQNKSVHIPQFIGGNRACHYCSSKKIKTKNGWYVYSSYKCSQCNVILCTGKRNCFNLYHKDMGLHLTGQENTTWSTL